MSASDDIEWSDVGTDLSNPKRDRWPADHIGMLDDWDDPNEFTIRRQDGENLVTTWISADVDDCMDLEAMR